MVLVKKWQFLQIYIIRKIGHENVLHDILEWKNSFPDHKNKKLKILKTGEEKIKIGQVNVVQDILERKKAFLGY